MAPRFPCVQESTDCRTEESAMNLQTIASALIVAAGIGCLAMIGLVAWVNWLIERGEFR